MELSILPDSSIFRVVKLLGRGTFGRVYLAIDNRTNKYVAIKRTIKWKSKASREASYLANGCLNNENIVRLDEVWYSRSPEGFLSQNLVMEYVETSLGHYIRSARKRRQEDPNHRILPRIVRQIASQLVRGLGSLHEGGVAHRDLKPDNILIVVDGENVKAKLCDLGSAKLMKDNEIIESSKSAHMPYICSRWYRAPELLFGNANYDVQVDSWSMGCILAELLTLHPILTGKGVSNVITKTDEARQIWSLVLLLGTPTRDDIISLLLRSSSTQQVLLNDMEKMSISGIDISNALKGFSIEGEEPLIDAITDLLRWNPSGRASMDEIRNREYFSI